MKSRFHGRERESQHSCRFGSAQLLEIVKGDHAAVLGRQTRQGPLEKGSSLGIRDGRFGVDRTAPSGLQSECFDRLLRGHVLLPAPQMSPRLVACDREEPGTDPPIPPKARRAPKRCQEGLLQGVLGDRRFSDEREEEAKERAGMRFDELAERVVIPSGRLLQPAPIG